MRAFVPIIQICFTSKVLSSMRDEQGSLLDE